MTLTRKIRTALSPMAIMAMTIGAALAADYPVPPVKIVLPHLPGPADQDRRPLRGGRPHRLHGPPAQPQVPGRTGPAGADRQPPRRGHHDRRRRGGALRARRPYAV